MSDSRASLTLRYPLIGRSSFLDPNSASTPGLSTAGSSTASSPFALTPSSLSLSHSASSASATSTASSVLQTDNDSQPPSPSREAPIVARPGMTIRKNGSRPSLRHMPSWSSFMSHRSRNSRASGKDSADASDNEDSSLEDEGDEDGFAPATLRKRISDGLLRGREREAAGSPNTRGTVGRGSTVFARALKKLSLSNLARHAEQQETDANPEEPSPVIVSPTDSDVQITVEPLVHTEREGRREDTPFTHPTHTPRKPSQSSLRGSLSVMPELSPSSPSPEEYFTPPTIPTSLLHSLPTLPSNPSSPSPIGRPPLSAFQPSGSSHPSVHKRFATSGITPTPCPTPLRDEPAVSDFDLDIFSPRVKQAPVLKGVTDSLPVSPLELPSAKVGIPLHAVLPALPRPLKHATVASEMPSPLTMPSLGQMASDFKVAGHSPVRPPPSSRSAGQLAMTAHRLPRASVPYSDSSPRSILQYSRRHSVIIRPSVLPISTPPSLIASPRFLGAPVIPPGATSPPRLDPIPRPSPDILPLSDAIAEHLPITGKRRSSMKRKPMNVAPVSPAGGLGFGDVGSGSGFRRSGFIGMTPLKGDPDAPEKSTAGETRIATPGTFGLQGEAEKRLIIEGVNPYFA